MTKCGISSLQYVKLATIAFIAMISSVSGDVPVELSATRADYEIRLAVPKLKLDTAIKARAEKYAAELKVIEDRAAATGQLDAVVLLKAEREVYEKGERTNGFAAGNAKVPVAARALRAAFEGDVLRLRAAAAPEGRALAMAYVKQLGDLERKLTSQKNVEGALAVRQEREDTQQGGLDPLNPPTTGLLGDWRGVPKPGQTLRGKVITFKRDGTWKNSEGPAGKWFWTDKAKRTVKVRWDDRPWEDTYTLSSDGKKLEGRDNQGNAVGLERIP